MNDLFSEVIIVALVSTPTHPVLACAAAVRQSVKDAAGCDTIFMSVDQKQHAMLELSAAVQELSALRLSVVAAADRAGDVADQAHARNVASWLAQQTRRDGAEVRREVWRARLLNNHPIMGAAVAAGTLNLDQAEVIGRALRDLDREIPDLDRDLRRRVVDHLVEAAAKHTPAQLRILGRRILEVIDTEAADEYERHRLDEEDQRASRRTYFTSRRNGDGTTDIRGRLSDALADRLLRYLHAFTNPRRDHTDDTNDTDDTDDAAEGAHADDTAGDAHAAPAAPFAKPAGSRGRAPDDRRGYDQQLGEAFGAFLEAVDPMRLPIHGGDATTVVVTIDLEVLRGQLAGAGYVGEDLVSAAQARRLACHAKLIPAVLGGDSEVLDLGRSQRLYGPAARRAKAIRHPVCQAEGCDIPATWCEAHHRVPWSQGGSTDLADLFLLCFFHHHRAHDPRNDTTYGGDGTVTYHRRTCLPEATAAVRWSRPSAPRVPPGRRPKAG